MKSRKLIAFGVILLLVLIVGFALMFQPPDSTEPPKNGNEKDNGNGNEPPPTGNTDISGIGAGFYSSPKVEQWLESVHSKTASMEGWFMFPPDLAEDVLWCVDIEFFEPTFGYVYEPNTDWVALVYVNKKGQVVPWFGDPNNNYQAPLTQFNPDTAEFIQLSKELDANVWHRIKVVADFAAKRFKSFSIYEPSSGMDVTLNLSEYSLWKNPLGSFWDGKIMGFYLGAFKVPPLQHGSNIVYTDDIVGEIFVDGEWITVLDDGFESQSEIYPLAPIMEKEWWKREIWAEGKWYQERETAVIGLTDEYYRNSEHSCFLDASPF